MIEAIFITLIIMGGLIYLQKMNHDFLSAQREQKDVQKMSEQFEARLKELDELRKRVDTLTMRAGFKL